MLIPTDIEIKVWSHYNATTVGCNYVPIDSYKDLKFVSRRWYIHNSFTSLGIEEFVISGKYDEWVWKFPELLE